MWLRCVSVGDANADADVDANVDVGAFVDVDAGLICVGFSF